MQSRTAARARQAFPLGALVLTVLTTVACVAPAAPARHDVAAGPPPQAAAAQSDPAASNSDSPSQAQASPALEQVWSSPSRDLRFERISVEEGLSQGSIGCIVQDSFGFMWFCTEDGLNRYDGYEFTTFAHDPDDPNSLGQHQVRALVEDQEGRLWIWKHRGSLDRYDRRENRFVHYSLFDPVVEEVEGTDFVWTLYQDASGGLWAGTYRSGLHQYDREQDRFISYRHDPDDPHSLSDDRVYAISEDHQGTLWVGTRGGLNRLDSETGRFTVFRQQPDDPSSLGSDLVQQIHEDRAGRLWVTTFGIGLELFDRETGRVVARYQHDPLDPQTLDETNAITQIYEDSHGLLWIVHFDGRLDRFDPQTGLVARARHDPEDANSLSSNSISTITEDRAGNLWVGTDAGLDRYDRETGAFWHYQHDPADATSLSSNAVSAIYQSRSGILWVGTRGRGLNLYDPARIKFAQYRIEDASTDPEQNNHINGFLQDSRGTLWVGTDAGLNGFDHALGRWMQFLHDPGDATTLSPGFVSSIYEDRDGNLWIGTQTGLDLLDRDLGQFTHYLEADPGAAGLAIGAVLSILQDGSGTLWLGRHRYGLCEFEPATGQCTRYAYNPDDPLAPQDMVRQVLEDAGGRLWLATQGGLLVFDRSEEVYTLYEHEPANSASLSHNSVNALHLDPPRDGGSGAVWVATDGGGLNRLDRSTGSFRRWTMRDGLPSNRILGIVRDADDRFWLSTSNGVSRFDPDRVAFKNYDTGDGLQGSEFLPGAYLETAQGEILFGGTNGFNRFHPAVIQDSPYLPPIVLTSLTQGGTEIGSAMATEALTEASFEWPNNSFEFEFAALSYSRPTRNQYAYMLEGFDKGWNLTGARRFGRYTNLPGGTYTLRLKGSNGDGVWNEEGNSLQITIVPPFWGTWWFRGTLILGAALALMIGFHLRTRGIEKRGQHLEAQIASRTAELATLNAIASVVSRSLDIEQILQDALRKTLEVTGLEAGGIYLVDTDGSPESPAFLKIAAHKGLSAEIVEGIDNLVVGEGFSGRVVQTCKPLIVPDVSADPRLTRSVVRAGGFHTVAIAPLVSRARVLGTLFAMSLALRPFSQQDTDLLTSIGGQIGVALENARLFAAEQRRAEQFRIINEVGHQLTSILDVNHLLREIVQAIRETFGYYMVGVGLIEGEELVIKAWSGRDGDDLKDGQLRLTVGVQGITGRVAASGEPLMVPDVSSDPYYVPWPESAQTRSELAVPLRTKTGVIGVLNVEADRPQAFDHSDLMALQALANQAAVAIETARLYASTESRLAQVTALQQTSTAVTGTLELDELLNLIMQQATALLHADGGILNLVDWASYEDEAVACAGFAQAVVGSRLRLDQGLSGWVTLHNQPVLIDKLEEDGRLNRQGLLEVQEAAGKSIRNAVAAPMSVKDEVFGTLVLLDKHGGEVAFDQSDLDLLVAFANHAATAINNARLFEAEQRRAEQFRVIAEAGRRLTVLLDVPEVLTQFTKLIQEAFGYYHVAIGLIEEGSGGPEVVYRIGAGTLWEEQRFRGSPARLRVGQEGVSGWVAAMGKPLLVPDVSKEPRYIWMEPSRTKSELTVPITVKGQVIGVLDVQSDRLNAFDETDVSVLESLAHQVGAAIENARLYEQAQQAAVTEERSRLARDLHDAVTQTLFSASLIAEAVPASWEADPEEGRQLLTELRLLTRGALAEMRTLLMELRPAALTETSLSDLLHQLSEATTGRTGVPVSVVAEGNLSLPPDVHIALYRIAQEALNNVVKHARASQVSVSLRQRPLADGLPQVQAEGGRQQLELVVQDDGRGFETSRLTADHMGLNIMRERAEAIGAHLSVRTEIGRGTQVQVLWSRWTDLARP